MRAVQVRDTKSFIDKAIETHGDKYDYSLSVFNGSQSPIQIVCKCCGIFTLSQAGSHYRKKKPCGCRLCQRMRGEQERKGEASKCKNCLKTRPYKRNGFCVQCRALGFTQKETRKLQTQSKNARKCKGCDSIVFTHRKKTKFCSEQCMKKYLESKRVQRPCDYCGRIVILRPSENLHRFIYCSVDCQQDHRATGAWRSEEVATKKGRLKKLQFSRRRSKERKKHSEAARWWNKCLTPIVDTLAETDPWVRKSQSAARTSRSRITFAAKGATALKTRTWFEVVAKSFYQLNRKCRRCSTAKLKAKWRDKCDSVSRNMRRRMQLKSTKTIKLEMQQQSN
jgi:hypothetical protein